MGAVFLRARSDLRSHWRTWATLALLVGLVGGAVTAAAAGARRTDSAFGRFLTATRAPDILTFSSGAGSSFLQLSYDEVLSLPYVTSAAESSIYAVVDPPDAALSASADLKAGDVLLRHKMLAGRPPHPDRADEVMVSFTLADQHHLHIGDTLPLSVGAAGGQAEPPAPVSFRFRIVGIEASAIDFPPQSGTGVNQVWATPAFHRVADGSLDAFETVLVRLQHGARDLPALYTELQRRSGGKPSNVFALSDQTVNTQRSIHLQAVALWMLAGLVAVAGGLVVTQLLIRQGHLESRENSALRALGMSRSQLWAVGMGRAIVIGALGGVVGAVTAMALSPLMPVGLARTAEPRPGVAVDWLALGLGVLCTAAVVAVANVWPAWRTAAASRGGGRLEPSRQERPSAVAEALSRASAPVPLTAGVRLALEPGRGRTAVPVRSTLTGAAIGVVALATAFGFNASLNHLLTTPGLYGVTWDARVTPVATEDVATALPAVGADPDVTDFSSGYSGFPVTIGETRVDGIAVASAQGSSLMPEAVEGRLPTEPDEVVLGSTTMAALHAHIGSTVRATVAQAAPEPLPLKIVGLAVFPSLSDAMGLGKGLAMTPDGLRHMIPGDAAPPPDTILVRFRPGTDAARATAELQQRVGVGQFTLVRPEKPVDLVNFGRVQALPLVLGALLAAFAAATLAHLLVTSIRRRRRDLAVLKTLGLTSGQVRATVAWQASTLALVAVGVGLPLGVAVARQVWLAFAHQLGIVPKPVIPLVALAALIVGTVAVANLVAVLPGRIAARTPAAVVLRSE